ncbi:MAG: BamA/TamA family outer membrane protein [Desulfovibrionaceae bacterium]|nr:BamA/TamA family outer membrane protein [Desulfovibrionaceae bacterium]
MHKIGYHRKGYAPGSPGRRGSLSEGAGPLRVLALLLVLALSAGCGLIFDGNYQEARQEESMDKESAPQNPLAYSVRFVVITSDGAQATASADTNPAANARDRAADAAGAGSRDADEPAPDGTADGAAAKPAPRAGSAEFFVDRMRALSKLVALKDELPDGELGLELRARKDVETAIRLMGSEGYYDGTADMTMEGADTGKATVTITLRPGPLYVVGDITVNYLPDLLLPERLPDTSERIFPRTTLPGVTIGEPVTAETMLKSVNSIPDTLQRNSFPEARIKEAYFYLDREKRTLNAIIDVEPGRPATIGVPVFTGNTTVKSDYLEKLLNWEPGVTLWNQEEIDQCVSRLRGTGLFRKVAAARASGRVAGAPDRQDVAVSLEEAEHRSLGVGLQYATDTGFGVAGEWEHRNLFGRGEKLNVQVPYSLTEKGVKADFTKPLFYSDRNTLHIWGEALSETTDAYERQGTKLNASIKRSWSKYFTTETGPFADIGSLENNALDKQNYTVYGLALKGTLDTRDNEMHPTTGTVTELSVQPMTGEYNGSFNAVGTELHVSGYWAPFSRDDGSRDDAFVLAARIGLGAISGASLGNLPSTYRYYMGGVSTVRGFAYQQIGPMDASGDPVGGRSYQNINLESRFKVTDDLGFVVFLDGGQLYKDEYPQFETDMDWGAGAGIRYFTPIGPLRFDVGIPLKDVDPPLQVYISIGQAF